MDRAPAPRSGPLAGIRVADFCWMGVGAIATRLLADFGADVIKIEDRTRIDLPRRLPIYKRENALGPAEERRDADPNMGGLFNNYSRNKLGITINMRTPEGRALAERLVTVSDIVTENFAPGVMERWGLTYERLRELNPSIIYARMSGYGHSGPHAEYRSYGPVVQAVSGLSHISGLPGREPSGWGLSYMDNLAAYYNSAAVLMAVLHREQTGEGTEIDVSAFETGISLLGPVILDVAVNNRSTRRPDFPTGNRLEHHDAAPHGVYPCAGNDRWAAIAVFDQDEWVSLVAALGRPAWTTDPRFATQRDRTANHDALDEHIAAWTRQRTPYDVMNLLQERGVRAAAVQTAEDLNDHDPQIEFRRLFFEMDHPVIGMARFEGIPMHMSRVEPDNWRSAPLLGEDNDHVFGRVLGLSEDERADLGARGVI